MATDSYVLWELMGSTDGRTRGRMAKLAAGLSMKGWSLAANWSSVGSDGHWPHTCALWHVSDDAALGGWLDRGWEDGVDENAFVWGKSKVFERVAGELNKSNTAYLLEYLVADSAQALATLKGADLVLAERLAPWQGVALWGAADLHALSEREWRGLGAGSAMGIRRTTGWWVVDTPDRDIV